MREEWRSHEAASELLTMHSFRLWVFLASILSATLVTFARASDPNQALDQWHWRNPLPQGNRLNGITFGNGVFVAVGDLGTILSSGDAVNWISRSSGTTEWLWGITFGNGTFVAVGDFGTILSSSDGVNWIRRTSGTTELLYGIAHVNGTFVAVGDFGTLLISTDGANWTSLTLETAESLSAITYGNGTFVAVGDLGTILTSPDGITWTSRSSGTTDLLFAITYGNGRFVTVGDLGTILSSTDGISWTTRTSGTTELLFAITYGNGLFVAVGDLGTILSSADGITWTDRRSGTIKALYGISSGNDVFATVGDDGTILSSGDGVAWTTRSSEATHRDLSGIASGPGSFVAVGRIGTIVSSPDGATWTSQSSGVSRELYGVTYGSGGFLVVGGTGTMISSTDGISWTNRNSGTTQTLNGIAYHNGTFVAVGDGGTILTSVDGVVWTSRSSATTLSLFSVSYGNGTFVVTGDAGTILSSADGVAWSSRSSGITRQIYGSSYGQGAFLVVGAGGAIASSPDGITWTRRSSGTTQALSGIIYRNGVFLAVGDGGTILSSADGVTWISRNSPSSQWLFGVSYANGAFVVVGAEGIILQSDPLAETQPKGEPAILSQPQNQTAALGQTIVFEVDVSGLEPFLYQWQFDGINLPGATNASLVISNAGPAAGGDYRVVVSNSAGSITSSAATASLFTPPSILVQPANQSVSPGANFLLAVTAEGTAPLSYQWRLNGLNIPGATNATLSLTNIQPANAGSYDVGVANRVGAVNSQLAKVTVVLPSLGFGDNFAGRGSANSVSGSGLGSNGGATRQPGEPNHAFQTGGKSVWFAWRAPGGGTATFTTAGSSFDTLLAVYTGTSVNSLTLVASDDDQGGFSTSRVTFRAEQGVEYQIAIDGFGGAEGEIVLSWQFAFGLEDVPQFLTPPRSESVLPGTNITLSATVTALGPVDFQWFFKDAPIPGAGASNVTFTFVLVLRDVQIDAAGFYRLAASTATRSALSPRFTLEIGAAPEVTSQDKFEEVFSETQSGLQLQNGIIPRKTGFTSVSAGIPGTQILDNFGSGKELGEPNHGGAVGGASRWFRLKAQDSGVMVCDTIGSKIDTVLAVYTGTKLLNLQLVAQDNNSAPDGLRSRVRFQATRGTDYLVGVDGLKGAEGPIQLNWVLGAAPVISQGPSSQMVQAGGSVMLRVVAEGTPAPAYQWRFNGLDIPGATNATLGFTNLQEAQAGSYRVVVRNIIGTVRSESALLALGPEPLRLDSWLLTTNGSFGFQLTGATGPSYRIEASTNLLIWVPLATNPPITGKFDFIDSMAPSFPMRFYRATRGE